MRTLSEKQQHFIDFASRFLFVALVPKETVRYKKFFGIVYGKEISATKEEVKYNDFSFYMTAGGNFEWNSGALGDYRPEGYMCGGKEADESMKKRLESMVEKYNAIGQHKANVVNRYVIFE